MTAAEIAVERRTRRTRSTGQERTKRLPGDELVTEPMWEATRAITIRALPKDVWPWIVQMGFPTHRGGWYTPEWTDRLVFGINARSADRIVPELQGLAIGDKVPDSDKGDAFFTVAELIPGRVLVLLSHTHPTPAWSDVDFSWAFVLEQTGPNTRLIMRARVSYRPLWPSAVVRPLVAAGFGVGDVLQAGGMLEGIKRRVEREDARRRAGIAERVPVASPARIAATA